MLSPSNPVRFYISHNTRKALRAAQNSLARRRFARELSASRLPVLVAEHSTPIYRVLPGVDRVLFENKKTNLRLALAAANGIVIRPGEIFSLWGLVGNPSAGRGFKPGLVIKSGRAAVGVGGGLCQLSNAIHWLALHSELEVTERHRHSFDIFPDDSRAVPFGTGATISYNYKDLRFANNGGLSYQLVLELTEENLAARLYASAEPAYRYSIEEEDKRFVTTADGLFRANSIWRVKTERNGTPASRKMLFANYCLCRYGLEKPQ